MANTFIPTLTIQLSHRSGGGYTAQLAFDWKDDPGRQAPRQGPVKFNFKELRAQADFPEKHGQLLGQALLSHMRLQAYFNEGWAASGGILRLVLQIDPQAGELHDLHWETLRIPNKDLFLAQNANLPFSRLLENQNWERISLRPKGSLKALAVVANPSELQRPVGYRLLKQTFLPVDVEGELSRCERSLQPIAMVDKLFSTEAVPGQASLELLLETLRTQSYDILYLVCHGALLPDDPLDPDSPRQPYLLLENAKGSADRVAGAKLINGIKALPVARWPRLVVMASCQSAGKGIVADSTTTDRGLLASLGPSLAQAGILAVVAMQGDVRMLTVEKFMPVFFSELENTDGQVDQAMAVARNMIREEPDWWAPVLFSRLKDGKLFSEESIQTAGRLSLPPAGIVPAPGGLSVHSRMPFPDNQLFTGREVELRNLAQALFYEENPNPPAVLVSGIGGCGKSQLAVALAYRFGRYLNGVHWVNAAGNLNSEIASCGKAMRLEGWPDKLPDQVAAVLERWVEGAKKGELRLVILDNLEESRILSEWLPRLSGLRLLVTTRRAKFPKNLNIVLQRLGLLERSESLALLRKLAPALENVPNADLEEIAERFGDLPLGLQLAGAYLRELEFSPREYLALLEQAGGALQLESLPEDLQDNPLDRELNLRRTFNLSWERLSANDLVNQAARDAFRACGYCAPNTPIPSSLLQSAVGQESSLVNFKLGMARLYGLGMLQESASGPIIHRLMAEFARLQDSLSQKSVLHVLAKALESLTNQANLSGFPNQAAPYRPHLDPVAAALEKKDPLLAGSLWKNLGDHLRGVGDYTGARQYYEKSLALNRSSAGNKATVTVSSLITLGFLLKDMGDYPAARPYFEEALATRREVLGEDNSDTAASLDHLGLLLKDTGDYPAARSFFERALAINRKLLGEKHIDTIDSLNNLGYLLKDMGEYQAARPYFEQALAIQREAHGEKYPDIATSLTNLGYLIKDMGDCPAARPYFEQALEIRREVLGEKHPDTATSLNNLGYLLKDMGEYPAARSCFEDALEIRRQTLGERHPATATSLDNLGYLLKSMKDYPAARSRFELALDIRREVLGEKHPDTATSLTNLGYLLKDMGDYPAAHVCFEQALDIRRETLGLNHPDTATSFDNLGYLLQFTGDYVAARPYFEKSLEIRGKVLGESHPATAISLKNLGDLLKDMGDASSAREYFTQALRIYKDRLPPDYPLIQSLRDSIENPPTP